MIEKIIILCLCSIAICSTTWHDMIFYKPAEWIESKIGWFSKPIFSCYVCASLWWSAAIALMVGWPVYYCLPAMGLSAVISTLND